jgi:hypothetical protein
VTLLYVFDSSNERTKTFFAAFQGNEEIGIATKVFRRVQVDTAKDEMAKNLYGSKVPSFVTYSAKGEKIGEVHLSGYKLSSSALMRLLVKTTKGHGKMSLPSFVKKYRSFLNKLDQLEGKKGTLAQKLARLQQGGKAAKLKKVQKEQQALAKAEKQLLEGETKLLTAVKAADLPPTKAELKKAPAGGS